MRLVDGGNVGVGNCRLPRYTYPVMSHPSIHEAYGRPQRGCSAKDMYHCLNKLHLSNRGGNPVATGIGMTLMPTSLPMLAISYGRYTSIAGTVRADPHFLDILLHISSEPMLLSNPVGF